MCMRVAFHQMKNGLSSFFGLFHEAEGFLGELVIHRFHALFVQRPVSSIFCVPSGFAQV